MYKIILVVLVFFKFFLICFFFTVKENRIYNAKKNSRQKITSNVLVNSQNFSNFELYYILPLQMFSKKVNSLKYIFDFTHANTENMLMEIASSNFEKNFY